MNRELVIAEDPAGTAARLFLDMQPRSVSLAGGRTPRALYQRLATMPYPWPQTQVFFGDERCVPPDHPDSNYAMAWETLLARSGARVHRMPGETCDAAAYERELRRAFEGRQPALDLALLGLGADGHTASLFPGDLALDEREHLVVRVERPDHARLTLTLPVFNAAHTVMFLVTGSEKAEALARLMAGGGIPAAKVEARRVVVVADREAAGARAAAARRS